MRTIEAWSQGYNRARKNRVLVIGAVGAVGIGASLVGMTWGGHELGNLIFGDDKPSTPKISQVSHTSTGDNRVPSDVALSEFGQRNAIRFNFQ